MSQPCDWCRGRGRYAWEDIETGERRPRECPRCKGSGAEPQGLEVDVTITVPVERVDAVVTAVDTALGDGKDVVYRRPFWRHFSSVTGDK